MSFIYRSSSLSFSLSLLWSLSLLRCLSRSLLLPFLGGSSLPSLLGFPEGLDLSSSLRLYLLLLSADADLYRLKQRILCYVTPTSTLRGVRTYTPSDCPLGVSFSVRKITTVAKKKIKWFWSYYVGNKRKNLKSVNPCYIEILKTRVYVHTIQHYTVYNLYTFVSCVTVSFEALSGKCQKTGFLTSSTR